ncbi:MAG: IS630 family transposase [Raineya sp.]|nr:IS630 family transposase [Raineya sp.]
MKEEVSWIQERWGIVYSLEGCVKLLHRLGFSYKKTKLFSCEADKEHQEAFIEELASIKETLGEKSVLYVMDACRPQHNTRSSYAWIKQGREYELPSVCGRKRFNINAALNASAPQKVVVRFDESIDAESTWKVYKQLLEFHQDKEVVYVVCDNARYYKNKTLQERLKGTKIKQIFLPAYLLI